MLGRNGRRLATVVVAVTGVLATTATSPPPEPGFVVSSPQKTITLVLDEARPDATFRVDVVSTVENPGSITVRADIRVDDDVVGDDANDGVAVVDVGLIPLGELLADDVDVAGDATQASVKEGDFGVERTLVAETSLLLAARLREGVTSARVSFVLVADVNGFGDAPAADDSATLEVNPGGAPDDGAPEGEEP